MKPFIVKVQLSLASSDGSRTMLAYNEDRSLQFESEAHAETAQRMGDRVKAFFWADLVGKIKGQAKLVINEEAPEQDW